MIIIIIIMESHSRESRHANRQPLPFPPQGGQNRPLAAPPLAALAGSGHLLRRLPAVAATRRSARAAPRGGIGRALSRYLLNQSKQLSEKTSIFLTAMPA
ncbi:hypothetical protein [Chromobacterium subtsugae]|uniref:hypothetical protein n=1 Tax=Chromobacterium subtsugae TaxID=251747 RepID=UPI00128B9FDD|nr:hypothetical protein [Chromobacterium subtsugae]